MTRKVPEPDGSFRRQYAIAAGFFVLLVLGIIFLFGQLMSRSLSRRYLVDTITAGSEEARRLAEEIVSDQFHVTEKRSEEMIRTLQGSFTREVLESIEVTNPDGKVVFTMNLKTEEDLPQDMVSVLEFNGALDNKMVRETESSYEIAVPLGEIGQVVGKVSKFHVAEKVLELRRELMWKTTLVAGLTVAALIAAFIFTWQMLQRTRKAEISRREAEQMAALGSLAANLAHEIRNPLNSININLELLNEDLASHDKQAQASLHSTREEVGRLGKLVNDFLTYARPNQPCLDQLDTASMVEEVVAFLKPELRQMGVHLRLGKEIAKASVRGDGGQLRQVLLNLVLNAAQAVAPLVAEKRLVELSARPIADKDEVALVVHDRGDGIPEEELEQVRRAFYTRRPGGTGLGLAIAERIISNHGGRLELSNLAATGFEATVILPTDSGSGKILE
jgi:signal transduction histidine kinase